MSILIQDISKHYGSQKALDKVAFEIIPGEIIGLLGPNGAGKSTLMKIITCFIPPTSGDVVVYGKSIHEQPLEIKKIIGYLPEQNPLYPEMYVTEYLEFVAGLHKIQNQKKRIAEIIDLTGLGLEKHKKIGALSKGYRQRVGLGQALIHDPKVLILDEPTSGLDPNQLSDIRSLIANAGKEKTVILSTHIMQEVEAMCKRVVIIDQGKIVTDRPIEQLQNSGGHRIIRVEFSVPVIAQLLEQIDGVERIIPTEKPHIFQLVSKKNVDIRSHVFRFAVQHNIEVLSMQIITEKLEDLFRSLTK